LVKYICEKENHALKLTLHYSGWGNGFNTATTPLWVSELVPAKNRGRHVAIEGNLIAFGIVIASYFNIGMSYASGAVQWRLVIAFQIVFIFLQVFWVFLLPESPRWLSQSMFVSKTLLRLCLPKASSWQACRRYSRHHSNYWKGPAGG
jgi:hypothetical protein